MLHTGNCWKIWMQWKDFGTCVEAGQGVRANMGAGVGQVEGQRRYGVGQGSVR